MKICEDNHSEICFEERTCPFCAVLEDHKDETHRLESQIGELESERDDLQAEVQELQSQLQASE